MRLKSALRRGVAAAVIAGIVVSSGIPAYAARWDIADGDITVKAGDTEGTNWVSQGEKEDVKDTDTVITGESEENTVTIDTSKGNVDVTFDDLKIDVSGKTEVDGSGDSPVDAGKAAVTVQGDHDAAIELDGDNELKSGDYNAGLEKNGHESEGTLTIKDDKGKDGSLTAEGGFGGAGIGGGIESTGSNITIRGGTIEAVGGSNAAGIGDGAGRASDDTGDPNPGDLYICGDAEVTAKAGSQMTDAKAPAIGGSYGEVPTENLSDDEHKVTGGRLTRLNADGTVMEGMGYDYTSTPKPQPDDDEDDDDDVPPLRERRRGRVAQAVNLVVDGTVLLNIGVCGRDISLGLVIVVVGDEIFYRIIGEKAAHLGTDLAGQRLIRLQNQRRAIAPGDDVRHRKRLAGAGDAQQRLGVVALMDALHQRFYRLRLVAGGLKRCL